MIRKRSMISRIAEAAAVLATILFHWVVFYFIIINSCKPKREAAQLSIGLPKEWNLIENYLYIFQYNDHIFLRSLWNSVKLTVISLTILILVASMAAFVIQRRNDRITRMSHNLILAGLIVPPSVIPTYWMLTKLHVAGTLPGLVLVEVATLFPFSTMLYKGYVASLPREIDEAAIIDGCSPARLFFHIVFPLVKPITATIVILRSVVVYNDFTNPLYYMSGSKNTTVQLCVYLFQSAFTTDWGHLFAAVVIVSMPPLLLYLFLNKQILKGMTMGAVKG